MACAVIMAGGRGERFWPRSRQALPKQFLSLIGDKTMLQQTVARLEGLIEPREVYVVAAADFREIIEKQLPDLPRENIITEPFGRDTAAAIGLAAITAGREKPRAVMAVLPADQHISNLPRFKAILGGAIEAAASGEDAVTLGIEPQRPETGYGYIRLGEVRASFAGLPAYTVRQFTEKPDYPTAIKFLAAGDYLWNSGIFIWRVDLIKQLISRYTPELASGLKQIEEAQGAAEYDQVLKEVYQKLPRISVDYGIMERAERVLVLRGDFGWDDLGSWTALERYAQKDELNNALTGRGALLDTENTYIYAPGNTVAAIGVKDLILVYDQGCLLLCHKDKAQEIKMAVEALKEQGFTDAL